MTPLLEALSSAFRAGYAVGFSAGYKSGVGAGASVAISAICLIYLAVGYLPAWRKKWKAEAKLRAARRDFKEFERGLPPPTRPAPPMPACKPPAGSE